MPRFTDRANLLTLLAVALVAGAAGVAIAGLPTSGDDFVLAPDAIPTTTTIPSTAAGPVVVTGTTLPGTEAATTVAAAGAGAATTSPADAAAADGTAAAVADPADPAADPAAVTTTTVTADEGDPTARVVTSSIAIIGDSYTAGSDMGGVAENGWPGLLEQRLRAADRDIGFSVGAVGGTGYVATGQTEETFGQLTERTVTADDDLVIVFGSRNDGTSTPEEVAAAATAAFAEIRTLAPGATLLVIGTPWVNENVPAELLAIRDALSTAATTAGATFVDPLADQWFFGADAALIGTDGVHPTDAGHVYMEAKIAPLVEAALDALAD